MEELSEFHKRNDCVKSDIIVTEQKVLKKFSNLKTDKSQGPGGINLRILKECRNSLVCVEVNPMGSCRAPSVYLTTLLLGRLSPLSG